MLEKRFSSEDFRHPNKTGVITLIQESRGKGCPAFCRWLAPSGSACRAVPGRLPAGFPLRTRLRAVPVGALWWPVVSSRLELCC